MNIYKQSRGIRSTVLLVDEFRLVDKEVLEERKKNLVKVEPKIKEGYLARYARLVSSASTGAVYK